MLDREGIENRVANANGIVRERFAWLDETAGNGAPAHSTLGASD
jgi:hypothetical protein